MPSYIASYGSNSCYFSKPAQAGNQSGTKPGHEGSPSIKKHFEGKQIAEQGRPRRLDSEYQ